MKHKKELFNNVKIINLNYVYLFLLNDTIAIKRGKREKYDLKRKLKKNETYCSKSPCVTRLSKQIRSS